MFSRSIRFRSLADGRPLLRARSARQNSVIVIDIYLNTNIVHDPSLNGKPSRSNTVVLSFNVLLELWFLGVLCFPLRVKPSPNTSPGKLDPKQKGYKPTPQHIELQVISRIAQQQNCANSPQTLLQQVLRNDGLKHIVWCVDHLRVDTGAKCNSGPGAPQQRERSLRSNRGKIGEKRVIIGLISIRLKCCPKFRFETWC